MKLEYKDTECGVLASIEDGGIRVPFGRGPSLYVKNGRTDTPIDLTRKGDTYTGALGDALISIRHEVRDRLLDLIVRIENRGDEVLAPTAIGLRLGVDSYMDSYPEWNGKFFPTFLRCERTHFTGYMSSPLGACLGIVSRDPIAAWELDYNTVSYAADMVDFGHRIYTASLLLTCSEPLPERHPRIVSIGAHETREWRISLFTLASAKSFYRFVSDELGLPTVELEQYTVERGSSVTPTVRGCASYEISARSPSGRVTVGERVELDEYGLYTLEARAEDGRIATATVYSRHDYGWYLRAARKNAVSKPQKASTNNESWYGWFSAFLASKHYPDPELDRLARANFDEVAPLVFDFEKCVPIIMPSRVQNLASFIGVLVDLYEADPIGNASMLDLADRFADELMKRQTPDGAFRKRNIHYTSVVYIAKNLLELALAERERADDGRYRARFEKHYASVRAAIDELVLNKERIGTEGEHTLEDGMISCSALQIGFFALTLPEEERAPYIAAAEYLMSIHRCLELEHVPDARMRGATLRFWEAQYDVMIRGNMLNSPHGWTSWKNYATYYLYLLTGKREYLIDTLNTMGACLACVDEEEELRWSFIVDPYLDLPMLVPDTDRPIKDGLASASHLSQQAYRGKFEDRRFGECYIPMISSWYRTGEQLSTGGYLHCPLIYDDHRETVDNQGGACDNDVHEHFKCLEETLLKKCFVIYKDGSSEGFGCDVELKGDSLYVYPREECSQVHLNLDRDVRVFVGSRESDASIGLSMLTL